MMLRSLISRHPFVLSVIVLCVVISPGYWRLHHLADQARDQAAHSLQVTQQLHALTAREDRVQAREMVARCRERNLALYRYRAMLRQLVEVLAADSGDDGRVLRLRELVPADADTSDCDGDGVVTPADYDMANGALP